MDKLQQLFQLTKLDTFQLRSKQHTLLESTQTMRRFLLLVWVLFLFFLSYADAACPAAPSTNALSFSYYNTGDCTGSPSKTLVIPDGVCNFTGAAFIKPDCLNSGSYGFYTDGTCTTSVGLATCQSTCEKYTNNLSAEGTCVSYK